MPYVQLIYKMCLHDYCASKSQPRNVLLYKLFIPITNNLLTRLRMKYMFGCCVQLLIMKDGERNHSMGSPMDGTLPQSKDR